MDTAIDPHLLLPSENAAEASPEAVTQEARLVEEASGGSEDAFRRLVETHQAAVYHFCFQWLRDAEDAREACQDTFLRAHRALDRYKAKGRFSTWLYQIALNLCRDRAKSRGQRQKNRTVALEDWADNLPAREIAPDEEIAREAEIAALHQGIAMLPDRLRVVVILSCLEGLSHEETAEVMNCSARAIEGRLYRARRMLVEWWNRNKG